MNFFEGCCTAVVKWSCQLLAHTLRPRSSLGRPEALETQPSFNILVSYEHSSSVFQGCELESVPGFMCSVRSTLNIALQNI